MRFNPVLSKELKVKMRNWKAAGMIGAYLLVMTVVATFILMMIMSEMSVTGANRQASTITYGFLAAIQFMLIIFIAPALTSGSISGERERQTLDLLLCTKLRPRSIILGKLFSCLSQVMLLIIASFPIFATVFVFGGISVANLLQLFLFYLVVAVLMGCIGVFFSTIIKKTTTSNVVTYAFVLFLLFGTLILTAIYMQLFVYSKAAPVQQPGMPPAQTAQTFFPLLYFNPLVGFASLLVDQFGGSGAQSIPIIGGMLSGFGKSGMKPWVISTIVNFGMACLLFFFSSLKVNPIRKKRKNREKTSRHAVVQK
ncbi:ABC transporter permease subunit [Clostridium sp. YIM B02515]|uniref:ABC transporter permease subunit n=1 Tax=Clostridium rhizosphaerae TaxID=2803861 RepID=A0ABS1TEA8_9CLOT|nr:ABC transporter permease subunit [Clostridium rhizosphaerae]MBL4937704.1 ABC transporter permease subunit [Clostridium rhizosphaerae]